MSDFHNEELTAKYAAPAAMPRKSFLREVWAVTPVGVRIAVLGWLALHTFIAAQVVYSEATRPPNNEIAAQQCEAEPEAALVIVRDIVFECEAD